MTKEIELLSNWKTYIVGVFAFAFIFFITWFAIFKVGRRR